MGDHTIWTSPHESALSDAIDKAVEGLGITPLEKDIEDTKSIAKLRRERRPRSADNIGLLTLINRDGVLSWQDSPGILPNALKGRRGFWGHGKVVKQLKYPKVGFSEVGKYLEDFDNKLTPARELRRWNGSELKAVERPSGERPILLFIHGTFSKNEAIFDQLQKTNQGKAFLVRMGQKYQILAFDHPTLSVSPMLNALDLNRILGGYPKPIDVICHSRGGLVTRWWLEAFESGSHGKRRAVLVGAPLKGTSLAAPNKIRHGIELLTNVGDVLLGGLSLIPCFTVAAGMLKLLNSAGSIIAATPVVDGIVAAVPGLAGMSLVENNFELQRLNKTAIGGRTAPEYFAISSNFQPSSPGWRFWHQFADFKIRAAHLAADQLIFDGENDLVVDTESMFQLAGSVIPDDPRRVWRFRDSATVHHSSTVHHTNYFLQPETVAFIEKALQ